MDIRDKAFIDHGDIAALNFIQKSGGPYHFRRYYKNGLRSHVMAVLKKTDVHSENQGVLVGNIRTYPKAQPVGMLRIFRKKFSRADQAFAETAGVRVLEKYLGPAHMAKSEEFIVSYLSDEEKTPQIVLCGLQAYIFGEDLDPWRLSPDRGPEKLVADGYANDFFTNKASAAAAKIGQNAAGLTDRILSMVRQSGMLPDLAGVGNLLVTPEGELVVVDINNIATLPPNPGDIFLDEKGYPVFDKSMEALALIDQCLAGRNKVFNDAHCRVFFSPERKRRIREMEASFHREAGNNLCGTGRSASSFYYTRPRSAWEC